MPGLQAVEMPVTMTGSCRHFLIYNEEDGPSQSAHAIVSDELAVQAPLLLWEGLRAAAVTLWCASSFPAVSCSSMALCLGQALLLPNAAAKLSLREGLGSD